MTDIISHRGPDGDGHYVDKNDSCRSLVTVVSSIIDSEQCQFLSQCTTKQFVVIFNGEIYNYRK